MNRLRSATAWLQVPANRARLRQVFHDASAAAVALAGLYETLHKAGVL